MGRLRAFSPLCTSFFHPLALPGVRNQAVLPQRLTLSEFTRSQPRVEGTLGKPQYFQRHPWRSLEEHPFTCKELLTGLNHSYTPWENSFERGKWSKHWFWGWKSPLQSYQLFLN